MAVWFHKDDLNQLTRRSAPQKNAKETIEDTATPISDDKSHDIDPLSKALVLFRSKSYNFFKKNAFVTRAFFTVLFNGIVAAYFIGALVYYSNHGESPLDWCNGHGLLIVVISVIYLVLLYFYIIKQFFGKAIYKNIFVPVQRLYDNVLWPKWYFRLIIYLIPLLALVLYLAIDTRENRDRLWSFLGVVVFMLFGFVFSKYPGNINWRPVFWGLGLQFIFGLISVRWATGRQILMCIGDQVSTFLSYTNNGTTFIYGRLITEKPDSPIFAFATLPVIFFFSFCVNILSYYGALQWGIMKIGWFIQISMGTTVCESVNAAASVFLGMTESPLLIKDYLKDLTKSEMHAIMCEGWATIAGTVLAAYISFGVDPGHLITASVMSAPAALCYAKLFYPETEVSINTIDNIQLKKEDANNVLDAASRGAMAGLELISGIISNIIAFLAFVAFLDAIIHYIGLMVGLEMLSFQWILSKVFVPFSFLMGVSNESLEDVAVLVGTKVVINEFEAYRLLGIMKDEGKLSPRTEAIATFALCGFSNFGSLGIFIGSLSAMAPNQRGNITEVAVRAFIAANMVCFLTAAIAGTLIDDNFLTS